MSFRKRLSVFSSLTPSSENQPPTSQRTQPTLLTFLFVDPVGVSCSQSAASAHQRAEQDTDHQQMINSIARQEDRY